MQASQIDIISFGPEHIDGAFMLSQQAQWPHRREDWAFLLSLSKGFVALEGGRVVGTAMATLYAETCATVNMVIVDASMRGRGLGRKLMDMALNAADGRECRLVATQDGLPLYEKLGFVAAGEIIQHQGIVEDGAIAHSAISWADQDVAQDLAILDAAAFGADRSGLLSKLAETGRFAILRDAGRITGYIALRPFGRGEVAGPVVAANQDDAKALLSFVFAARTGSFLRVDTAVATGLAPWLTQQGLVHVGGGVPMRRNAAQIDPNESATVETYALASQSLG
ncbi:GNAT family N-acetyltransferase [Agrobacterium vitis]|uniref:GNAT family N-acetyltransferase n=1 Tax=Rhizobium/Agrobacterium group TaxID=227290 RepID=UPI0008DC0F6A|nr:MULTISPECIES: GNAT family N-acetyltransferase [Rhizobium/Agrobacterium group]MCF1432972.1 GNAT family N-acetyltransferase [Allorhizobium ampelinum]MUO89678.1 GNAT family N-acetyltransferase [Agrobacterium vitis]MUZ51380.1 GNAT family N-acetyltransferase [Agrobacterium vitis]MUZ92470.1 GNAT family N-acetyltransferase [Agrobacterium vitis]MVA41266.1 GNAT family N-acetyltransferase [Agrobacterium vitis]